MANQKILGSKAELKDPNHNLSLDKSIPLGIQHVLAMFASNVTPAIIIAGAAGFAFGGADMVYLVQMAMLFAGMFTLSKLLDLVQLVQGYQLCRVLALHSSQL